MLESGGPGRADIGESLREILRNICLDGNIHRRLFAVRQHPVFWKLSVLQLQLLVDMRLQRLKPQASLAVFQSLVPPGICRREQALRANGGFCQGTRWRARMFL